jgi:hypothetical protein
VLSFLLWLVWLRVCQFYLSKNQLFVSFILCIVL